MVFPSVTNLGVGLTVEPGFGHGPQFEEGDGVCELVAQSCGTVEDAASQVKDSEMALAWTTGVVSVDLLHVQGHMSEQWPSWYVSFFRVGEGKYAVMAPPGLHVRNIPEVEGDTVGVQMQPVKRYLFALRGQMLAWMKFLTVTC